MLTKNNQELREENTILYLKNLNLDNENIKLKREVEAQLQDLVKYEKEIKDLNGSNRYLLQRLKELRHKTWFPVYKENLELQEQNRNLDETCQEVIDEYRKLEKEVEQYKAVLQSVEQFVGRFANEKR
jgi:myosin heavy subunit